MKYHSSNKMAWEEAYANRKSGWGDDLTARLRSEPHPFLEKALLEELAACDLKGKTIAQFCCNNGRELLSLYKQGAECGVGFDIAENMVFAANEAAKQLQYNCSFIATDILDIGDAYHQRFDVLFITIGAITWFEDLNAFFAQAARCLKTGGRLVIHEAHPLTGMLAMKGDGNFDPAAPANLVNSYFKPDPWIETNGMGYLSDPAKEYQETFYSYSHPFDKILSAILQSGLQLRKIKEFERDISGSFVHLSDKGIPLSYLLVAHKES